MNLFRALLSLTVASVLLIACSKEKSIENSIGGPTSSAWEFKDTSVLYQGTMDTAYYDNAGAISSVIIEGKSNDGGSDFYLQLFSNVINQGTYSNPNVYFRYTINGNVVYTSVPSNTGKFSVTIDHVDSTSISGTFSGEVTNPQGKTITIRDGKFSAKLADLSSPPPVTVNGEVMFWSKGGCTPATVALIVTVNSVKDTITSFHQTAPGTCGTTGTATQSLPPGSYNWTAACGGTTTSGTVSIVSNTCTKVEVNFTAPPPPPPPTGDYFPMTANSSWTYQLEGGSQADTSYIFSAGTTKTFAGNAYTIFLYRDEFGGFDSAYYRKNSGSYYEYIPKEIAFLPFDSAQNIEYIFLKDNVAQGATWESSFNGKVNGITATIKIQGTLLEKATSVTVGSQTFQDVLKVRLSFIGVITGLSQEFDRYETWYARGKGGVKQIFYTPGALNVPEQIFNIKRVVIF